MLAGRLLVAYLATMKATECRLARILIGRYWLLTLGQRRLGEINQLNYSNTRNGCSVVCSCIVLGFTFMCLVVRQGFQGFLLIIMKEIIMCMQLCKELYKLMSREDSVTSGGLALMVKALGKG